MHAGGVGNEIFDLILLKISRCDCGIVDWRKSDFLLFE